MLFLEMAASQQEVVAAGGDAAQLEWRRWTWLGPMMLIPKRDRLPFFPPPTAGCICFQNESKSTLLPVVQ